MPARNDEKKELVTRISRLRDHIAGNTDDYERRCRDDGELYGYARILQKTGGPTIPSRSAIVGRVRHLEKCYGLETA